MVEQRFKQIESDISYFSELYKQGEQMMRDREAEYYAKMQKDKDGQFYLNILKQGTMSDRISALTTII